MSVTAGLGTAGACPAPEKMFFPIPLTIIPLTVITLKPT